MEMPIRRLNSAGIEQFKEYLSRLRAGSTEDVPLSILVDQKTSDSLNVEVIIKRQNFQNRYDLGKYLVSVLSPLDRRQISRDNLLWNWLTLFFFDSICKQLHDGTRVLLRPEMYILESKYDYLRYYKHLVRTPWLAVLDHKENAQILFVNSRGVRSDIEETLTASQQVLGNPTIMAAAHILYFDIASGKPKLGAGGKSAGSPRRLTAFVQQLDRTYDIQSCTPDQFLALLPAEFAKFKPRLISA